MLSPLMEEISCVCFKIILIFSIETKLHHVRRIWLFRLERTHQLYRKLRFYFTFLDNQVFYIYYILIDHWVIGISFFSLHPIWVNVLNIIILFSDLSLEILSLGSGLIQDCSRTCWAIWAVLFLLSDGAIPSE